MKTILTSRHPAGHTIRARVTVLTIAVAALVMTQTAAHAQHAWAWGSDSSGQLGNGANDLNCPSPFTCADSKGPVPVNSLTNVIAVAGGGQPAGSATAHSLALTSSGTVWASGSNNHGQLGNGTFADSSTPTQVTGLADVIAIAAGGDHSLALTSLGTVWAWGLNGTYGAVKGMPTRHNWCLVSRESSASNRNPSESPQPGVFRFDRPEQLARR